MSKTGTIRLLPNNSYKLTATVLPTEAPQDIEWSTSSEQTATVSNGTITAVASGTATITATAKGTNVSATITVEVLDNTQKGYTQSNPLSVDEAIALMDQAGEGVEVFADDTGAKYFITGVVDTGSTITGIWKFTMSGSSKQISFKAVGTEEVLGKKSTDMKNGMLDGCTVIVQAILKLDDQTYSVVNDDSEFSRRAMIVSCTYPTLTDIIITEAEEGVALYADQTTRLHAVAVPAGASLEGLEWVSSASDKASVDNDGIVKGVATGTAQITAKVENVTSSKAVTVTVRENELNSYNYDCTGAITSAITTTTFTAGAKEDFLSTFLSYSHSEEQTEILSFTTTNLKYSQTKKVGFGYNKQTAKDAGFVITTKDPIKRVTFKIIPYKNATKNQFSVNGEEFTKEKGDTETWDGTISTLYEATFTFVEATSTITFNIPMGVSEGFAVVGIVLEW